MTDSSAGTEDISSETEEGIERIKERSAGTKENVMGTEEGVSGAQEIGWKMKKGDLELLAKEEIDGGVWFPKVTETQKRIFEKFLGKIDPPF